MSPLPPPAETLARVQPGTRYTLAPAGAVLHVLVGAATRCGRRTAASWTAYGTDAQRDVPTMRLCPRCAAGLPAATRKALVPTAAELRKVHEREARYATAELVARLAAIRAAALLDGSAYEGTRVIVAELAPRLTTPRGAKPPTKAERGAHVSGHVATARPVTLLDLLNRLDPTRPDLPGHRFWVTNEPAVGSPVDVGSTYDPRLWMGRKR